MRYYDIYNCELVGNRKPFLTNERQGEDDRKKIRDLFKQMLDIASRVTEEKKPEVSIVLDGIGLVLASDFVEAVSKIFSMLKIGFMFSTGRKRMAKSLLLGNGINARIGIML